MYKLINAIDLARDDSLIPVVGALTTDDGVGAK